MTPRPQASSLKYCNTHKDEARAHQDLLQGEALNFKQVHFLFQDNATLQQSRRAEVSQHKI